MNIEIEYKFLVSMSFFESIKETQTPTVIEQAYLLDGKDFHMRVRIEHTLGSPNKKKASLTTKTGKKPSREEYEIDIPLDYAVVLVKNSISILRKWRYKIKIKELTWELDYYPDDNLVVAEVEVPTLDYPINMPSWVIKEVTKDSKYSNTTLAKKNKAKINP